MKYTGLPVSSLDGLNTFRVFLPDFYHFSFSASAGRVLTASFNSHCACLQILLVFYGIKKEITSLAELYLKLDPKRISHRVRGTRGVLRTCKHQGINFISSKFLLVLFHGLQLGSSHLSLWDL